MTAIHCVFMLELLASIINTTRPTTKLTATILALANTIHSYPHQKMTTAKIRRSSTILTCSSNNNINDRYYYCTVVLGPPNQYSTYAHPTMTTSDRVHYNHLLIWDLRHMLLTYVDLVRHREIIGMMVTTMMRMRRKGVVGTLPQ
jgi:hypothetical protein